AEHDRAMGDTVVYYSEATRKSPPIALEGSTPVVCVQRATKPDMRQCLVPGQLRFLGQRRLTGPTDQSSRAGRRGGKRRQVPAPGTHMPRLKRELVQIG